MITQPLLHGSDAATALRDIHMPPAPSWWPPAPGWWLLAAFASILLAWLCVHSLHRLQKRRRVQSVLREFDRVTANAASESAALAAASALLRRAARLTDPAATQFEGEAWLTYLDGMDAKCPFSQGDGRVLVDGMFNRSVDATQTTAALRIARNRLRELLMGIALDRPHA